MQNKTNLFKCPATNLQIVFVLYHAITQTAPDQQSVLLWSSATNNEYFASMTHTHSTLPIQEVVSGGFMASCNIILTLCHFYVIIMKHSHIYKFYLDIHHQCWHCTISGLYLVPWSNLQSHYPSSGDSNHTLHQFD